MNLPGQAATAIIAFAPLLALFAYAIVKAQRKKRAQDQSTAPEPPFTPDPEVPPGRWLARFNPAQRTYLRQQFPTVRACFAVNLWFFSVILGCGMLPQFVDQIVNGQNSAQRVWFAYLLHLSSGNFICSIIALLSALIAISPLLVPTEASFQRTRPLPRAFQYWTRVLPIAGALLAALALAAVFSFALMFALHGPVWRHLLDGGLTLDLVRELSSAHLHATDEAANLLSPLALAHLQAQHVMAALQTRAVWMVLSTALAMMLVFSMATALFCPVLHAPRMKFAGAAIVWCVIVLNGVLAITGDIIAPRLSRFLFLYVRPGPPPPLVFALVPLAAVAAFFLLGEFLSSRIEP